MREEHFKGFGRRFEAVSGDLCRKGPSAHHRILRVLEGQKQEARISKERALCESNGPTYAGSTDFKNRL